MGKISLPTAPAAHRDALKRPPHRATVVRPRPTFGAFAPLPAHRATVLQPKSARPHPATVVQPKPAFGAFARLPPHPATLTFVGVAQPAYLNALVGGGAPAAAPAPVVVAAVAPAAPAPIQPVAQYTAHWLNYHHRADQQIAEQNDAAIALDVWNGIPAATTDDTKVVVNYTYTPNAYLRYLVVVVFYRTDGSIRFHSARRARYRGTAYGATDIVLNLVW